MESNFHHSPYQTLSEATKALLTQGFTNNFKLDGNQLRCIENEKKYAPADMEIVEYHRFEGMTNPADMSIVFAVKCSDGTKGSVVSSFGVYSDEKLDSFMKQVKTADRTEAAGPVPVISK